MIFIDEVKVHIEKLEKFKSNELYEILDLLEAIGYKDKIREFTDEIDWIIDKLSRL